MPEEIRSLTDTAKLRLIEQLWDDLSQRSEESPVEDWQKLDLDRRKAEFQADPSLGETWDEVEKAIKAGYGRTNS